MRYALEQANKLVTYSREELMKEKKSLSEGLRAELDEIYVQEQAMHAKTFVGNEDVLRRIDKQFNEGFDKKTSIQEESVL
ncbi:MAG: hypothetical protein IIA36_12460, partial [Proteobacteria bacterium]|nr:hypothetical protein [Pseudomonadota bacterium]